MEIEAPLDVLLSMHALANRNINVSFLDQSETSPWCRRGHLNLPSTVWIEKQTGKQQKTVWNMWKMDIKLTSSFVIS